MTRGRKNKKGRRKTTDEGKKKEDEYQYSAIMPDKTEQRLKSEARERNKL